jgi:hypothetical protein
MWGTLPCSVLPEGFASPGYCPFSDTSLPQRRMTSSDVTVQAQLALTELEESRPVIYDRPIGLRLLYRDRRSGAEHYVIRYPPGSARADAHAQRWRTRSSSPAEWQHCLFVIIFHGTFDVTHQSRGDRFGAGAGRRGNLAAVMISG